MGGGHPPLLSPIYPRPCRLPRPVSTPHATPPAFPAVHQVYLEKACELRGACMGIPDELAARMPLAYVHFTHCLVDMLLFLTPYALYPRLGLFSVPMTGVIALFYRGLVELSKSFLDPFGNRRVSLSGLSADVTNRR